MSKKIYINYDEHPDMGGVQHVYDLNLGIKIDSNSLVGKKIVGISLDAEVAILNLEIEDQELAAISNSKDMVEKKIPIDCDENVQWIVNDLAELGVKIGDQFFFLYKGRSYKGGRRWRYVGKREFGECCHPWEAIKSKQGEYRLPEAYEGFHGEGSEKWSDLPWSDKDDLE